MHVHVHGARCPDDLVYSSVLFAGRRIEDATTICMYVHVHGARCPDDLMYRSVLFTGQRVGDVTVWYQRSGCSMGHEDVVIELMLQHLGLRGP